MIIYAIDPHAARPHAWLAMEDDEVIGKGHADITELFNKMVNPAHFPDVVLIEEQFVSVNVKTALQLASAKGEVVGVCKVVGVKTIVPVYPRQWQVIAGLTSKNKALHKAIRRKIAEIIKDSDPCIQNCYFMIDYYRYLLQTTEK